LVRQGFLSRAGRFYAWAIALGHAGLFAFGGAGADVRPAAVVASALRLMSIAGGVVAWGAAKDSEPSPLAQGLASLASERGIPGGEQRLARVLATMRVVARSVGFPAVCLVLASGVWVPEAHRIPRVASLALGVAAYALAFGVVFGALARLSALASPRQGRIVFSLLVLLPYAVPNELEHAPSIVRVFSMLIAHIAVLGEHG
jgi:hypothetical protein